MTYIVASLAFVVQFAWMLILMYAAFELALYLLSFAQQMYASLCVQRSKNVVAQLKEAHQHAWQVRKNFAFALV